MPHRQVRTPVEQLQPFEWGRIVGLWEAGWTYRRIAAHVGHNVFAINSIICLLNIIIYCGSVWNLIQACDVQSSY